MNQSLPGTDYDFYSPVLSLNIDYFTIVVSYFVQLRPSLTTMLVARGRGWERYMGGIS